MNRVTIMDAAFVQLLGDNIYDIGTHDAFDARLDGSVAPIQSAYIRNHIEYYCDGNHDSGDPDDGIASRHNYYCPIPVQGVTSPVPFPSGEHPEDNYSFDYGLVHFSVLDSTAWGNVTPSRPGLPSPARQASIRTWLLADLAASDQPWKIVVTHHPLICTIDKSDIPSFATQIIEDVANLGADLILVGHSHTYQRSYPLVTYNPNDNPPTTFILDTDNEFEKGAHVIQVVAGTGGRPIRSGTPASGSASDWLDSWFSTNSSPQGEVGPVIIDVSPTELHVQYIAADNGFVFDEFKIVVPGPKIVATPPSVERTIFIGDPVPSGDSFSVANGGPDMMNYSLSESTSWFNVSPTTGDSTGEADTIDVTYLPEVEGFLAGEYVGQITITSPEASNSPLMIPVTLTIESVSPDFDGDGDVDIDDHAHLQECLSGQGKTQNDPNCADALLQGPDTDVDQDDLQVLIGCLSGKNIPADPTCDD
jgi:hypothetical protein